MGYKAYLKDGAWPKETGEPLKGVLMIDLRYNRYSVMEVKRNKNCLVCGDSGIAGKAVPILTVPIARLRDSTSRLYEEISEKMRLTDQQVMLFAQKANKTVRIEKGRSLRKLGLGARSVLTAVAQQGPDYSEAIVKLSKA
jgi:hypothetical protein